MPFAKLGLTKPLLRGVQSMGCGVPTPLQLRVIPPALEGHHFVASAWMGSGKTAAFALPVWQRLESSWRASMSVLELTRELAIQGEAKMLAATKSFIGQKIERLAIEEFADTPALPRTKNPPRPCPIEFHKLGRWVAPD